MEEKCLMFNFFKKMKKEIPHCTIGEIYVADPVDPFDKSIDVRIVDIKHNYNNDLWIKYQSLGSLSVKTLPETVFLRMFNKKCKNMGD